MLKPPSVVQKILITLQYDYIMQSTNFSITVSIQMCNFSMNAALFRCLACRPAAFLAVWGGQTERETPLADFKLHAARVRVCVGLAALVRVLSGVGGKLPNVAALQAEYAKLQEQKETLCADYGRLKKQVKEYDVIKRNIDSILRRESEPERGKENVRG